MLALNEVEQTSGLKTLFSSLANPNVAFSILGALEKRAVVQWFSRIEEIPFDQRISLGTEASREIFLDENTEKHPDIDATTILNNVPVCR